jgi:signal transduction histidine kinase
VSYGKAEGSGLGLAIVKKIVEDHAGEIYLDGGSETGTLFKITIPFRHSGGSNTSLVCGSDLLHAHVKKRGA